MPVRYQFRLGGTFTPTSITDDFINFDHDVLAATFKRSYLYFPLRDLPMVKFAFSTEPSGGTTTIITSNAGEKFIVPGYAIDEKQYNLNDQDPIAITSSRIYWRPDGSQGVIGRFVSNLSTGTNSTFQLNDGSGELVMVWHDTNAALDSFPVHVREANGNGNRVIISNLGLTGDLYIRTNLGRYVKMRNGNVIGEPELYFDTALAVQNRLVFVSPTNANTVNDTNGDLGFGANDGIIFFPLFLNAAANQYQRVQADLTMAGGQNLLMDGFSRTLLVIHNANAAVDGVPIYMDNGAQIFKIVSPTAADVPAYLQTDKRPYGFLTTGVVT